MTTDGALGLFRHALVVIVMVAGPMLLVALVVGLIVGVLQAATQINEASVSFVTKLLAVAVTLIAVGSWSLTQLVDYTSRTLSSIANVGR